jgi:VWFA-related protein
MMTRRDASVLCGFGLAGGWLRAQESAVPAEVNLTVLVRSAQGGVVRDLGISDFSVEESGVPQTIRSFSRDSNPPLTVGLLMDNNDSRRRMLEREAAYHFLQAFVGDRQRSAFVIEFGAYVDLRQYLTSSSQRLETALQSPEPSMFPARLQPPFGVRLYDAVVRAAEQCLRQQRGRKACILLSDGIDAGSKATADEAIESALRAQTPVYVVLFFNARSLKFPHPAAARVLQRLAAETGGGYFEVSAEQPIERVFEQIGEELRSTYRLGYRPEASGFSFRAVRVSVARKDFIVQAPGRYYAAIDLQPPQPVRIVRVEPQNASPGDVVTTSGDGLDRSNVADVLLTDGVRTLAVETVEQMANSIQFKVPEQAKPGPWVPGEKRPHLWSILLRTPSGDLFQYVGFQIAVD